MTPQTLLFFEAILLGMILALFFDIFRILRIGFNFPMGVIILEDVLFFIVSAVITYLFMLSTIYGQVRGFIIIGETMGFVIYYFTIGKLVISASKVIINIVKKILILLFKIFILPFIKIFKFIFKKINRKRIAINQKIRKVNKNINFNLKIRRKILYNIIYSGNKKTRFKIEGGDKREKS